MRPLDANESNAVRLLVDRFGEGVFDRTARELDAQWWRSDEGHPRLFLVGRALAARLRESAVPPADAGLLVGRWRDEGIRWSLEGIHEVGRRASRGRVRVKEKSAQLFLYGRKVLGEGVIRADRDVQVGDLVIVLSPREDVLGLARAVGSPRSGGEVLDPVQDRGWYLREGG